MGKENIRQWREYNYPEWDTGYLCPSFCLTRNSHLLEHLVKTKRARKVNNADIYTDFFQ